MCVCLYSIMFSLLNYIIQELANYLLVTFYYVQGFQSKFEQAIARIPVTAISLTYILRYYSVKLSWVA